MKLSVIVATRNRARAIIPCLDSIAAAFAKAAPLDAEIVVVDNGSTDNTREIIARWISANPRIVVKSLSEPRAGPEVTERTFLAHKRTDREHRWRNLSRKSAKNDAYRSPAWCRSVDTRARARSD